MKNGKRSNARNAFRTLSREVPVTSPATPSPEPSYGLPGTTAPDRTCEVCGVSITGRTRKKACSGKCRVIASRARRHAAVVEALHLAEAALVQAHEAVAAMRKVADLGPHGTGTLKLGGRS